MKDIEKIKLYKSSENQIIEEYSEVRTSTKKFLSCLNTRTKEEIISSCDDILQEYKMTRYTLKEIPSDIKTDHKKTYYKIQLNKTDWDKVFEADNKDINYQAIGQFLQDTQKFYEF